MNAPLDIAWSGSSYPSRPEDRTAWIRERRGARSPRPLDAPAERIAEQEPGPDGQIQNVTTLFLTNSECPWHCLMCDLWRSTIAGPTPAGVIPNQIASALKTAPPASVLKLYNSGSFFDRRAVPLEDHPAISRLCEPYDRVIVESHPALVGERVLRFRDRLRGHLEVAMGLETVHPQTLERLNKRMTAADFQRAATFLHGEGIDVRAFVLLRPPSQSEVEGLEWAVRSVHFAQTCGVGVVTLIPSRGGNGALEFLRSLGYFAPPQISSLETAFERSLAFRRGRVFADLWDLQRFARCTTCYPDRRTRLERMNLTQTVRKPVDCERCRDDSRATILASGREESSLRGVQPEPGASAPSDVRKP